MAVPAWSDCQERYTLRYEVSASLPSSRPKCCAEHYCKHTHCLEPVDWFHDHNESTPQTPRYYKAFCYVECTARVGNLTATLELRLYLRAKTVRRLNRDRAAGQRLSFRSKNTLACAMLKALKPLLPADWTICVQ